MHGRKLTTIYFLWHSLVILYVLLCALVLTKIITPQINKHYFAKENFITKISGDLKVENVSLHWQGLAPSLVLHDVSLIHTPHAQVEHISKIFAVVDLWKSLFGLNLDISKIIVGDITLNLTGTESAVPSIKEINDLRELLKSIHYQKLNFYLENISVKNLTIKYQKSGLIKMSNLEYTSSARLDNLSFNIYALDNEATGASIILSNYKDQLGNVIRANYNFKANGKYPDYIVQKIQDKFKLQGLSGYLAVNYDWSRNSAPKIKVFHDLSLSAKEGDFSGAFNDFKGHLAISLNSADDYTVKGVIDKVNFNNHVLQNLKYDFGSGPDDGDELRLQNLDLAIAKDLAALFSANKNLAAWLKNGVLGGFAKDLYFSGDDFLASPTLNVARANVAGMKLASWQNYPGVDALDVKLKYLGGVGDAILRSSNVNIAVPAVLKEPLPVKLQETHVGFSRQEDSGWEVSVPQLAYSYNDNDILGSIKIAALGTTAASFKGDFKAKSLKIVSLKKLLAAKPLNPKLRKWLMSSVDAGVLEDAALTFAIGDENEFSFNSGFNEATLKFASNWPQLENLRGKIFIDNNKFEASSDSALMKGQGFDSIKVDIADLHNPTIEVAVNSKINFAKAKNIIDSSPLSKTIGKYFSGADMEGGAELNLTFSLNHARNFAPEATVGELLLANDTISWPQLHFALTNAKGKLSFQDTAIVSNDIEALYHKDKVNLTVLSDDKGLHADMKGLLDARKIAGEYLPSQIAKNITGKSDFKAVLDIFPGSELAGSLNVNTNAVGISINYPKPLSKKKNLKRPISFKADFTAKDADYALSVGSNVKFVASKQLAALDIYIDNLNAHNWLKYFNQGSKIKLQNLNIFAKKLTFNKEDFKDIKVGIVNKTDKVIVSAKSKKVKGDFIYLASNKMKVDLDYLYLVNNFPEGRVGASELESTYDISIKKLFLPDYSLKNIKSEIKTGKSNDLKIKQLKFSYNNSDFDIKGDLDMSKFPKSTLEGNVKSADFSEIFSYIPSLHNFNKGSGNINFYITWPNTIDKFDPKLSSAMFDVEISDGMITDIGAEASKDLEKSKALNFLSMRNIVEQLSSDGENEDSYTFDKIEGNLIYSKGILNTDKIAMKGDFGSAYIKGDINLKSYSYDLYMAVMPIITSSIPTIAALAGGVFAGAVAWAANQLVENPISKIAMKVYKISGSLKNPRVVELDDDDLPEEAIFN